MVVILKSSTPAEFLASVPSLVGFTPRNSVVLVAFRGKRTCGALRFDLPASPAKTVSSRVASAMVGTVCKLPNVDAIAVVIYTDARFEHDASGPQRDFSRVLQRRIEHSGFELRALLCHAVDRWASYLHPFPVGGRDLAEVVGTSFAASLPAATRPRGDQFAENAVAPASPKAADLFTARVDELCSLVERMALEAEFEPYELEPLSDLPFFAEQALTWNDKQRERLGPFLVTAIQSPVIRDLIMLQRASSIGVGNTLWYEDVPGSIPNAVTDGPLGSLIFGIGPRPRPGRMHAGIELLRQVLSLAKGRHRLPILAMLAWLYWAIGRGSACGSFLRQAIEIDSSYGMVDVLTKLQSHYPLPEWAFE